MASQDSFGAKATLDVEGKEYEIFRLDAVSGEGVADDAVASLPYSLKVLLENLLRTEDGANITADDIQALAGWDAEADPSKEIQFTPARVIMQDFTGVPCVVDLATMREAMEELGGDASRINPLAPAEMVIDHSVIADVFGSPEAFERNVEIEYERNRERYQFLRWGQGAFDDFKVVPPGTGIVHQVNIEHLARTVFTREVSTGSTDETVLQAYPDTCVGTDSHTTMVNGIGVVGWGVGGIEAEAAMLGQPVSMLIPRVVGFKLNGDLPEGATATDLVLTITEMLRKHGVVGKFVEFYGPGVSALPLANRATIGNMSPEFGSTIAVFPIDEETIKYLELTGREPEQLALVEAYAKEQGLWHDPEAPGYVEPRYSERLELDLTTVVPSLAGPKRPQDRVSLSDAKEAFRTSLADYVDDGDAEGGSDQEGVPAQEQPDDAQRSSVDEASDESFPSSDAPGTSPGDESGNGAGAPDDWHNHPAGSPDGRPSNPAKVTLDDGTEFDLDHGAVAIAAITSCTNTSNPSVMIGAALLAKKAVEKGLQRKPWVKTTLAPGSKVVSDYYERAELTPYLDKLGFNLVGYGCTTCIGNSGPLIPEVSQAVNDNDLAVVSVLSGNRNFEGRINPDVKMNYLASPPLVVAYALAGSMDCDLFNDSLGKDTDGNDVYLRDIWPSAAEVEEVVASAITSEMFTDDYSDVFAGDERWKSLETPDGDTFAWDEDSTYVPTPSVLRRHAAGAGAGRGHRGGARAAEARRLGDHRPHLARGRDQEGLAGRVLPARARRRAAGLQLLRVAARQPRDHDPRHVRQHPAAQPAGPGHRGWLHPRLHPGRGRRRSDHERLRGLRELPGGRHAAGRALRQGVRLGLVARLGRQGHRAAGRQGRHRRVLRADPPLEPHRHGRAAVAVPRGRERRVAGPHRRGDVLDHRRHRAQPFDGSGQANGSTPRTVKVKAGDTEFDAVVRIDTPGEADYYRHGGIMQYVLRSLLTK